MELGGGKDNKTRELTKADLDPSGGTNKRLVSIARRWGHIIVECHKL